MTPREALRLAMDLLELGGDREGRIASTLAWAGIPAEAADTPVGHGGPPMLQRTGFAAAIVGDPEVLLLDEPLRALPAIERLRMLRLPGERRTMVLASRYPASELGFATHIGLLRGGRLALLAPASALEDEGLPLSLRGIGLLAERHAQRRPPAAAGDLAAVRR
jgi:ABC-type multidrug transport system ATPase subunit